MHVGNNMKNCSCYSGNYKLTISYNSEYRSIFTGYNNKSVKLTSSTVNGRVTRLKKTEKSII